MLTTELHCRGHIVEHAYMVNMSVVDRVFGIYSYRYELFKGRVASLPCKLRGEDVLHTQSNGAPCLLRLVLERAGITRFSYPTDVDYQLLFKINGKLIGIVDMHMPSSGDVDVLVDYYDLDTTDDLASCLKFKLPSYGEDQFTGLLMSVLGDIAAIDKSRSERP